MPGLNDRALGWLRFIWDKATTPDDWSDQGEPLPWWDRYTAPPMCSFPRFDVHNMSYVLPVMLEATPAWREVYTRISDELIRRYTSFWGAVDWCTLIGPDPGADRYPPAWQTFIPEPLRGRYAVPGWTGNGIEPWGLQPDPCGADGNVFYRGWLNLLLGIRRYVSGEATEHRPLEITGYQNRQFTWTHARIAEFISAQFRSRPQGPHCENTKIWPFCVSATGLGLKLYDAQLGTTLSEPVPHWFDYLRRHYMSLTRSGELRTFALYYDPMEQRLHSLPGPSVAHGVFPCLLYMYPQDREFSLWIYELAMRRLGWSDPDLSLSRLQADPNHLSTAMWMAHEVKDTATEDRIRDYIEHIPAPVLRRGERPIRILVRLRLHLAPRAGQRHPDARRVRRPGIVVADLQRTPARVGLGPATPRRRLPQHQHPARPERHGPARTQHRDRGHSTLPARKTHQFHHRSTAQSR